MASVFHDAPALHDEDAVSVTHGTQAMSDDQAGTVTQHSRQPLLDQRLGFGVDIASRFVQNEDALRVVNQRPCQRQKLPLSV